MLNALLWALGTGFVTGAVMVAIMLYRRPVPGGTEPRQPEALPEGSETIEDLHRRLADAEERLDAADHLLRREQAREPRRPPL